ncbi:MAG TPA: carbon storage regulator [Acidimicrobiales bacterium]|nr:carbon storage regulator [Acidimicrobiales bacterium]
MLVLSRRPDSSILVGHDVTVTVELVAGDDVCLRVTGPETLTVQRIDEQQVISELARRGKEWQPERMHVLSRRTRPGLLINGEVVVAVQAISNESVRIGIEAPAHVLIYREEVYQQMQEANRSAASTGSDLAGLAGLFPGGASGSD